MSPFRSILKNLTQAAVTNRLNRFFNAKSFHFFPSNDHDSPKALCDVASTLNGLDKGIRVNPAPYPRWNISEDDKALYIRRDMSGLDNKDVKEFVEFPRGVDSFFGYRMNDFGYALVYRGQYPPAVLVIEHVGVYGPPDAECRKGVIVGDEKYIFSIQLPGRLFKTFEIKMAEENLLLKLTIPKVKDMSIPGLTYDWERSFQGKVMK